MKAVILAAGKGTRMKHLTVSRPKPMVEVCGKPILEHILTALRDSGIREFVLVTGYFAEQVENYFLNGDTLGIRIHYIRQKVQNEIGEAFNIAREWVGQDSFFPGYGAIIAPLSTYPHLSRVFQNRPWDACLSLN